MRAMIVESDAAVAQSLSVILQRSRWTVDWAPSPLGAWTAMRSERFDAVLLGLGAMEDEALGLLRRLRFSLASSLPRPDTPTLVMTARGQTSGRLRALDAGADGCLITPVGGEQLDGWLRDLRRRATPDDVILRCGHLEVEPMARLVYVNHQLIDVHAREFQLLLTLLEASPRTLSRLRLEVTLYGRDHAFDGSAVEVLVHRLRKKLGEGLIRTVRGQGYCIAGPAHPSAPSDDASVVRPIVSQ